MCTISFLIIQLEVALFRVNFFYRANFIITFLKHSRCCCSSCTLESVFQHTIEHNYYCLLKIQGLQGPFLIHRDIDWSWSTLHKWQYQAHYTYTQVLECSYIFLWIHICSLLDTYKCRFPHIHHLLQHKYKYHSIIILTLCSHGFGIFVYEFVAKHMNNTIHSKSISLAQN